MECTLMCPCDRRTNRKWKRLQKSARCMKLYIYNSVFHIPAANVHCGSCSLKPSGTARETRDYEIRRRNMAPFTDYKLWKCWWFSSTGVELDCSRGEQYPFCSTQLCSDVPPCDLNLAFAGVLNSQEKRTNGSRQQQTQS